MLDGFLRLRTTRLLATLLLAVAIASPDSARSQEQRPGGEIKKVVPAEVGLYAVLSNGDLQKITGRPTNFVRTGSWLASTLTMGLIAYHSNTQFAGESAYVSVGRISTFYYRVSQESEYFRVGRRADQTVPGTINLILTQMRVKRGRRQYEFEAMGAYRRSRGISIRSQFNFDAEEVAPGLFHLRPEALKPGQYAFFLFVKGPERQTMYDKGLTEGFIYDFAVQ